MSTKRIPVFVDGRRVPNGVDLVSQDGSRKPMAFVGGKWREVRWVDASDESGKVTSTASDKSGTPSVPEKSYNLEEVVATFTKWLHLPDLRALYVMLATIAANSIVGGDPVWTLFIGPPGSGKTEMLQSTATLPRVFATGTLTESSLLSGTPQRDRAKDAKGGLLRSIGDEGIILCKDFGSILSMHRDGRAQILAALREVFDGSWTRHVGSDGGQTLHWSGKVGFLGGATQAIDRHHAVMASMGERFLLCRLPKIDARKQARAALQHADRAGEMRRELAAAVAGLFASGLQASPRTLELTERESLIALASLVVQSRSAVERDGYKREIELVPDSEAPARLVVALDRLLAGLQVVGLEPATAWDVVRATAFDSVPTLRRRIFEYLRTAEDADKLNTTYIAEELGYPTQTARRALEDLTAHGVIDRKSQGPGRADLWTLSDLARELYDQATVVPDLSGGKGESVPETSEGAE